MVNINISNRCVPFKLGTGAEIMVVPNTVFKEIFMGTEPPTLRNATQPLLGPGRNPLDLVGVASLWMEKGCKEVSEDVYDCHLHTALLGRSAICKLELVAHLDNIKVDTLKSNYPKPCSGLGEVYQPYTIKLKPGAEPFSLKTPR